MPGDSLPHYPSPNPGLPCQPIHVRLISIVPFPHHFFISDFSFLLLVLHIPPGLTTHQVGEEHLSHGVMVHSPGPLCSACSNGWYQEYIRSPSKIFSTQMLPIRDSVHCKILTQLLKCHKHQLPTARTKAVPLAAREIFPLGIWTVGVQ